jgi:hypothetical protein
MTQEQGGKAASAPQQQMQSEQYIQYTPQQQMMYPQYEAQMPQQYPQPQYVQQPMYPIQQMPQQYPVQQHAPIYLPRHEQPSDAPVFEPIFTSPEPVIERVPLVQVNADQLERKEFEHALILMIVGVLLCPVVLIYVFYATRKQGSRAKMIGNVSCAICTAITILSVATMLFPILFVTAFTLAAGGRK